MNDHSEYDYDLLPGKFNLETGSKTDFITSLEDSNSKNMISQFLLEVNNPTANINVLTDNFNNIIINAANKHFILNNSQRKKEKRNINKNGSAVIVTFSKENWTTLVRNLNNILIIFIYAHHFTGYEKSINNYWRKLNMISSSQ